MVIRPPVHLFILLGFALLPTSLHSQQPTGTVTGMVSDATGARIPRASVSIAAPAIAFSLQITTTGAGLYAISGLAPGHYSVRIGAPGFRQTVVETEVEVGRTSTVDAQLQVGAVSDSITVSNQAVRLDVSQATLQGVVTESSIRDLPLNGRNFLALGELQPGAQAILGGDLPGVQGFNSALGMNGQSGMTTRSTLDGLDLTDDHFGAVAANVSQEAIREFQVSRSAADLSTGITGNGAVNIASRSGANEFHGVGFFYWRDEALAAQIAPERVPFGRKHFGFSAGGPLRRDRLFWFANYERIRQTTGVATVVPAFPQFSDTWQVPYDERMALARVDWNVNRGLRLFGRFLYNSKAGIPSDNTLGGTSLVPRSMVDFTNGTAAGIDFVGGRFTHSIRFGYFNVNSRAVAGNAMIPGFPQTLDPEGRPLNVSVGAMLTVGTNGNTPQHRFQDSYETRYDGGASFGRHTLRWGALVNFIRSNWYETLNRTPGVTLDYTPALEQVCHTDPLCYPIRTSNAGNGLGWMSEVPTLGFPHGGFKNNRLHAYLGDSWRATSRLHVSAGLGWFYEPGQNTPGLLKPAVLENFQPGLSQPDQPDWNNLAPQIGIAWSPSQSGKWVVRANAGLYYDTYLLRNEWWVRNNLTNQPIRVFNASLNTGLVDPITGKTIFILNGSDPTAVITPGTNWLSGAQCQTDPNYPMPAGSCALGTAGLITAILDAAAAYQQAWQTLSSSASTQPSQCETSAQNCQVMDPHYSTPYTLQFSVGVQRELRPGLVLSVDYVRHRGQHYVQRTDVNHVGAAANLDVDRAIAAIVATHQRLGCGASASAAAIDCAISKNATIFNYGDNGLGGASGSSKSKRAFPGDDPAFNRVIIYRMRGWSTYSALQVHLQGRLPNVHRFLKDWTVVSSYALGRYSGTAEEQNMVWFLEDDLKFMYGPTTLDRTHIFSFASSFTTLGGLRLSSFWRASSPLSQSLFLPPVRRNSPAEIFTTDLNGDGSAADPLLGTNRGSYGRDAGCGGPALNRLIDAYNSNQAGHLTPAGQALVDHGLFTVAQLKALGAVSPSVTRAPDDQVCLDSFSTTDIRISRPLKLHHERLTLEPALEIFNLFNVANYDVPYATLGSVLDGLPGSPNGTTPANRTNRAGVTGGSMSLGAPRSWQLSVRVSF